MYYKVVTPFLTSVYATSFSYGVQYVVDEWTRPKLADSKLFVFDTLENAKKFCESFAWYIIYECEAMNPFSPKETIAALTHDFKQYWLDSSKLVSTRKVPDGTLLCDAVKLTRLIEGN